MLEELPRHQHLSCVMYASTPACFPVVSASWTLTHGRGEQITLTVPLTLHEMFCSFARVSREPLAANCPVRLEAYLQPVPYNVSCKGGFTGSSDVNVLFVVDMILQHKGRVSAEAGSQQSCSLCGISVCRRWARCM